MPAASAAAELERLWRLLQPLAVSKMPLEVAPPRSTRFGSPLVLSRMHWVKPELVAKVKFLTWTEDNLLRHVVYQGLREDKPARDVWPPACEAQHRQQRCAAAKITRPLTSGLARLLGHRQTIARHVAIRPPVRR